MLFAVVLFFIACKKNVSDTDNEPAITQLYPLIEGSKWIYIDSFFDYDNTYYGCDTFYLKPAKKITRNNIVYTPITDQWEDSIFKIRSDETAAFILEPLGESILFRLPVPADELYIDSSASYFLYSKVFTDEINSTIFPSYKVIITQNDGYWRHYKQEELYFTPNVGIVKGYKRYKNSDGSTFISDSFVLIAYIK